MADAEAALRDALAAVAEALDVPSGDVQERSDRAIIVGIFTAYMFHPGANIAVLTRSMREQIAERAGTPGEAGTDGT